jgi:hypothetical protein
MARRKKYEATPEPMSKTQQELSDKLTKGLPTIQDTGFTKHLQSVKPDPDSKGQGVLFVWNKTECRMVKRFGKLTCQQKKFTGKWIEGPVSDQVLTILRSKKGRKYTAQRKLVAPACPIAMKA